MSELHHQVKQFFTGLIKGLAFFFGLLLLFIIIGGKFPTLFSLILVISIVAAVIGAALGLFKGIIRFIARTARDAVKND